MNSSEERGELGTSRSDCAPNMPLLRPAYAATEQEGDFRKINPKSMRRLYICTPTTLSPLTETDYLPWAEIERRLLASGRAPLYIDRIHESLTAELFLNDEERDLPI